MDSLHICQRSLRRAITMNSDRSVWIQILGIWAWGKMHTLQHCTVILNGEKFTKKNCHNYREKGRPLKGSPQEGSDVQVSRVQTIYGQRIGTLLSLNISSRYTERKSQNMGQIKFFAVTVHGKKKRTILGARENECFPIKYPYGKVKIKMDSQTMTVDVPSLTRCVCVI